jgi:hypothetical protein
MLPASRFATPTFVFGGTDDLDRWFKAQALSLEP